jgi:hypothetical protein
VTGVRIRWAVLAKVAAIAVGGLAALQVLPGMLRAPEPPPLAADVGLPRVAANARFQRDEIRAKGTADREPRARRPARDRKGGPAASAVIGSAPRRHGRTPKPAPDPAALAPIQPPAVSPPPAPIVAAESDLPAAPESPNDGSVEFAPH